MMVDSSAAIRAPSRYVARGIAGSSVRHTICTGFRNMVATFGTALDVTVAELVIEAFYPADAITANELVHSCR